MERVVLIGFRGSGKTAVGRRLARMLHRPFIDTDSLIEEKAGTSIPEIFGQQGEGHFRALEKETIADLPAEDAVISPGGGAVMDPENLAHLRSGSMVFFLEASPEVLEPRIARSGRPPLTDRPLGEEIRHLLGERTPVYRSAADFCIRTGERHVWDVSREIARIVEKGVISVRDREAGAEFLLPLPMPENERKRLHEVLLKKRHCHTRLCAIIGSPCQHSKSPQIYNQLFSRFNLNYYYARMEWPDLSAIMREVRRLQVRGLAVTIPFKQSVIPFLDQMDRAATGIGAVNTVVQCGGTLHGFNTDWIGIQRPLTARGADAGTRAVVLGAGGAAAAAVYALQDIGMEVTVLNRTRSRAEDLAQVFGCGYGDLSAFEGLRPEVVVNATPVGMEPHGGTLLSRNDLAPGMTVFDLVYTPPRTELLAEAESAGCTRISGVEMFTHQLCAQFAIMTGIPVSYHDVRKMLS
ncbi:MAG: shikimate dehydrogenase [Methanomicrobiaceae archaeon]|nr:shikimate dehydrogenase [Methanomicrobiaceae archaeon]